MNSLTPLRICVYCFPVLLVVFAVLAGATLLAQGLGDDGGARVLARLAQTSALLLTLDTLFLVGLLGLRAIQEQDEQ